MPQTNYEMKIDWEWGNQYRFSKLYSCVLSNLDEVDSAVRHFLDRVAKRYTYDCGNKDIPLRPSIFRVTLTPYLDTIEIPHEKIEEYQTYLEERGKSQ